MYNGGPTSPNLNRPYYIAIFDQTAYFTEPDSHQVRSFSAPSTYTLTLMPTSAPSEAPTATPTAMPTSAPSPTATPTAMPTSIQSRISSSAIPNYMSVGLYNPVWWISASLLLLMW